MKTNSHSYGGPYVYNFLDWIEGHSISHPKCLLRQKVLQYRLQKTTNSSKNDAIHDLKKGTRSGYKNDVANGPSVSVVNDDVRNDFKNGDRTIISRFAVRNKLVGVNKDVTRDVTKDSENYILKVKLESRQKDAQNTINVQNNNSSNNSSSTKNNNDENTLLEAPPEQSFEVDIRTKAIELSKVKNTIVNIFNHHNAFLCQCCSRDSNPLALSTDISCCRLVLSEFTSFILFDTSSLLLLRMHPYS